MSRLPKRDNESALLSTQFHVIDNSGNKEHWGDQPIVFPTPDGLIVRPMLALLTRQKTGKRMKNKSNRMDLAERRAAKGLETQPVPSSDVRTKLSNKSRPTHIAGIRIRQKPYLRGGPPDCFAAQAKEIISPKIKFLYSFTR